MFNHQLKYRFRDLGHAIREEFRAWRSCYLARRPLLVLLIGYGLLLTGLKTTGFLDRPNSRDPIHKAGSWATVVGVVTTQPDANPRGIRLVLEVETVQIASRTHSAAGNLMVQAVGGSVHFAAPGDRLRLRGRIQKPSASIIPGTFDYGAFLANKNIYATMYTSARTAINMGPSDNHGALRWGWRIHTHITSVFDRLLSPEESAVLSGLVVGKRPRFNPEIRRIFIETGTMHILVASGSNVAFVVSIWFVLARFIFRLSRRWALLSALPAVCFYALAVGADAPIVRAAIMSVVGIVAFTLKREDRPYHALGMSAWALLLLQPKALFDIGFQMSFVTVFGLVYFLPRVDPLFRNWGYLPRLLGRITAATMTAQIWLVPISLSVFKRLYPLGALSNMFVIPLSGGGLLLGFVLVAVDLFHTHIWSVPGLLNLTAFLVRAYLQMILWLVRVAAEHASPTVWLSSPGTLWTIGFFGFCLSIVHIRSSVLGRLFFAGSLMVMACGWGIRFYETRTPDSLQLTWIDTGRNHAVLATHPGGNPILVAPWGAVSREVAERTILPFLAETGVRRVKELVLHNESQLDEEGIKALAKWVRARRVTTESNVKTRDASDLKITFLNSERRSQPHPVIVLQSPQGSAVLSRTINIEQQKELLPLIGPGPVVVQSRFSPKWKWHAEFLAGMRPTLLVETGFNSLRHPSEPPWPNVPLAFAQQQGTITWTAPSQGSLTKQDSPHDGKAE